MTCLNLAGIRRRISGADEQLGRAATTTPRWPRLRRAYVVSVTQQTLHKSFDVVLRYIRIAEIWRNNVTGRLFAARQVSRAMPSGDGNDPAI